MKMLVGAMAYFEIEVPNFTDEEYEDDKLEPVFEVFWRKYRNKELGQGEMDKVEVCEIID